MLGTEDLPDELLERILFLSTARDIDGQIARRIFSVSRRWKRIISPVLYRHLAYQHIAGLSSSTTITGNILASGASSPKRWRFTFPFPTRWLTQPTVAGSARLFQVLGKNRFRAQIYHLMIHDNLMPVEILQQLAHFTHMTLRTLTIWPAADMESRLRFFDETTMCFPYLTHVTFVGNIRVRQSVKISRPPGPPRFPSVTHIHLIGSILYPPFTHSDEVPLISTVRYSHLTFDDTAVVLRKMAEGLTFVRDGWCHAGDFSPKIHNWIILYAPLSGTDKCTRGEFNEKIKTVQALLKEPWAQGRTLSIREDTHRRPHARTPEDDSWDAVVHRLAVDEM